jgi:hypothetical protein
LDKLLAQWRYIKLVCVGGAFAGYCKSAINQGKTYCVPDYSVRQLKQVWGGSEPSVFTGDGVKQIADPA